MTTVISIGNEKGGVGKTTLSINFGAFLAEQGYRVMILDADAQAHSTIGLGLRPTPGFYDLIARDAEYREVIKVIPTHVYSPHEKVKGVLTLMPGNLETAHIASHIQDTGDLHKIHDRLQELDGQIDIVIIDHSPTPSLLHTSLYYATDILIAPCVPEFFSMESLANTMKRVASFSEKRQKAGIVNNAFTLEAEGVFKFSETPNDARYGGIMVGGIIPTLYMGNTVEHSENLQLIIKTYGDMVTAPLPLRTVWREASMQKKSLWVYGPDSVAAKEARTLMQKLMGVFSV